MLVIQEEPAVVVLKDNTNIIVEDSATVVINEDNSVIITTNDATQIIQLPHEVTYSGGASGPCDDDEENWPVYSKRVDFISDNELYRGEAQPGTTDAQGLWRIRKITISAVDDDIVENWATGNDNFDKVWNNRLGYSYS